MIMPIIMFVPAAQMSHHPVAAVFWLVAGSILVIGSAYLLIRDRRQ